MKPTTAASLLGARGGHLVGDAGRWSKDMKDQAEQIYIREAKSYLHPLKIAEHLAARAFVKGDNAFYDACTSLVFLAFTIEAFCNHIGWILAPNFDEFDRLCTKDKLRRTAELVKYHLSLGKRPFQTFQEIFRFRNGMAHSHTQEIRVSRSVPIPTPENPASTPKPPLTEWEAYCTPEMLTRAITDVKQGLSALYNASPLVEKCSFDEEKLTMKMSWRLEPDKLAPIVSPGLTREGQPGCHNHPACESSPGGSDQTRALVP